MQTDAIAEAIADRLADARQDAGLTQTELADRADISRPRISEYERGERLPGLGTLYRLAGALEVEASALIVDASDFED